MSQPCGRCGRTLEAHHNAAKWGDFPCIGYKADASGEEFQRHFSQVPEGRKDDGGKPRWDLLPWGPLEEVAAVLEFGARKYSPNNWQKVEGGSWRYLRAGIGHLAARARGERTDPESGLSHLAHAACCVLFLMWFDKKEST